MNINSIDDIKLLRGDAVLVKQIKDCETRKSGLVVPETVIEKRAKRRRSAYMAEVVMVGNRVDHEWLNCGTKVGKLEKLKKGDTVWCDPVSLDCPSFEIKEQIYRIIRDEDLLAMEVK